MALDGILLNAGSGGETLQSDQISSRHYQISKIAVGGTGTAVQVEDSAPFPIKIRANSADVADATPLPIKIRVSGADITTGNPLPISAGANLDVDIAAQTLGNINANLSQVGGSAVGVANPLRTEPVIGAAVVADANPLPIKMRVSGADITTGNPLPVTNTPTGTQNVDITAQTLANLNSNISQIGGSAPGTANPLHIANVIGGTAVADANPFPIKVRQGSADVSVTNPLYVSNYEIEVAKGNVTNHELINLFGFNSSHAAATEEAIWPEGGTYTFLSSASTLEIVSSSASDTNNEVELVLLDGSFDESTVTVNTNGTTAVTVTGGTYLRVNRMRIITGGTVTPPVGNITLQVSGGGTVIGRIDAGEGNAQQLVYTVPNGKSGLLRKLVQGCDIDGNTNFLVSIEVRYENGAFWKISTSSSNPRGQNTPYEDFDNLSLPEKTDLVCLGTPNDAVETFARLTMIVYS